MSSEQDRVYAVECLTTGTLVGCYTKARADTLRDEWNALSLAARNEQPYITVPLIRAAALAKGEGKV